MGVGREIDTLSWDICPIIPVDAEKILKITANYNLWLYFYLSKTKQIKNGNEKERTFETIKTCFVSNFKIQY